MHRTYRSAAAALLGSERPPPLRLGGVLDTKPATRTHTHELRCADKTCMHCMHKARKCVLLVTVCVPCLTIELCHRSPISSAAASIHGQFQISCPHRSAHRLGYPAQEPHQPGQTNRPQARHTRFPCGFLRWRHSPSPTECRHRTKPHRKRAWRSQTTSSADGARRSTADTLERG